MSAHANVRLVEIFLGAAVSFGVAGLVAAIGMGVCLAGAWIAAHR